MRSAAIIAVVVRVWLIVVLSPASFTFLSRFFILHLSFQVRLDCLIVDDTKATTVILLPLTKLTSQPNRQTLISVEDATAPFQDPSIDFEIGQLASSLECFQDIHETGDQFGPGKETEKFEGMKETLCLHVIVSSEETQKTYSVMERMKVLRFIDAVHGIFISRFATPHAVIRQNSIAEE